MKMDRSLYPIVEKIIIEAITITKICALSGGDYIQHMMDFFICFFFDINLFWCLCVL